MRSKLVLLFALLFLGLQANAQPVIDSARERIISMPLCSSELSPCRSAARQVNHSARGNHGRGAISMTGAAWKDTQQERGSKPRLSADLLAVFQMTAAGIKPGHPSPIPVLSSAQKQALSEAWHAGYHVGLPLVFTAIVYVESSGCVHVQSDTGIAFGCSQVQVRTAYKVTGAHIPAWMLSDDNLRVVNMAIGAQYLQMCVDRFGWPVGAGCYEQGIPRTRILQRKGCFRERLKRVPKACREVQHYTASVLAAMKWLRNVPVSEE